MKKYAFPLAALLLAACNSGEEITTTQTDEPVARILEYTPAPGQFINEEARSGGAFDNVDTPEKACRYAAARFAENNWVSLGGWGGYLVAAFAEPVPNTGGYDLYVKGNAMNTSSEPGVVWVMQDANGNGVPDDTWYELKGSEYDNAATIRGYAVTYTPLADGSAAWTDDRGGSGTIDRMDEHTQASYGTTNRLRISDAVTADGSPANLQQIDFIKVQTGVNAKAPLIGEISTEVCGIGCYRTVTKRN